MECKAMFGDPGDVFFSDDVLQRNRYIKRGALGRDHFLGAFPNKIEWF